MTARHGPSDAVWLAALVFMLACLALRGQAQWLIEYPKGWQIPVTEVLDSAMDGFVAAFGWFFRAMSDLLDIPMRWVRTALQWLPWPVTIALVAVTAHAAAGWRLAVFSALALFYMVVTGYWSESMNSLALVAISVPMAVMTGFAVGVWGFFSPAAHRVIMPSLDLLQTIPAFAYLLPILLLFGFGPVVGLIASVLFAFPPMVRNTILGLQRVPAEVVESGLMSGATPAQLFWQVRVPAALKQILLGVNQATMAAFSMVIIASIIGGTADIGWEVLSTMRKAQFGESMLAGIVIALMAMVMDRITAGFALSESVYDARSAGFLERHRHWVLAAIATVILLAFSELTGLARAWPEGWRFYPADIMNNAVTWLLSECALPGWLGGAACAKMIESVKTASFFYLMLPVRIGLEQTISPFSWGFTFTPMAQWIYAGLALALSVVSWRRLGVNAAIAVAFFAILLFFGLTRLPWPALIIMAALLGWSLGGVRLAMLTTLGLGFILVTGVWPQAMLSIYLCGIAVLLSFAIGTGVGILASEFNAVSRFVRPINDTLQTMPLFVILIPFVMIYKIGEFTALLAIIAYAIVPAIRYSEHGLRSVAGDVIEAARSMGATRWQLLWRVKLPLALPELMLGLNQTIMYGIAMLVIAALVGTNGLGQQVYIGLGDGDFGVGMVAGIGMAIIAIIADRMTQAWSRARQEAFGL